MSETKKKVRDREINWDVLEAFCQTNPTLVDCVSYLNFKFNGPDETPMHTRTLERKIREKYDLTYAEYKEQKMWYTRYRLKQKMIDMALTGDRTMLIFVGKNFCEMHD